MASLTPHAPLDASTLLLLDYGQINLHTFSAIKPEWHRIMTPIPCRKLIHPPLPALRQRGFFFVWRLDAVIDCHPPAHYSPVVGVSRFSLRQPQAPRQCSFSSKVCEWLRGLLYPLIALMSLSPPPWCSTLWTLLIVTGSVCLIALR